MAFALTRSGKGVGLVIPTILRCQDSAEIHDIKGTNRQLTVGSIASSQITLRKIYGWQTEVSASRRDA